MSGHGVRRVTVDVDLERFEADLSEGGYEGLGRAAAWKLVKEDQFGVELPGRDYGLRVISDDLNGNGSVTRPISPFMIFCLGALSATAIILIGVAVW